MKASNYQKRFYRDSTGTGDLYQARIMARETDLQIFTDKPIDKNYLRDRINRYRRQIEDYIAKDRKFLVSLKPVAVELKAPLIVRKMSEAAKKANVGPMAAVAGAIAEFLGRDLLKKGCRELIIENGGDIFLKIKKIRKIGIYAGKKNLWQDLKLKIRPEDSPLGICTSSGTIGHSLSFGFADSVIILASNAALADSVATAAANLVKSKEDLAPALNFARLVKGVRGVVIILKDNLASWGKIEFVK